MAEVKREHREAANLAITGVEVEPGWPSATWVATGKGLHPIDQAPRDRVAQVLAEAEQRGAERERAAIVTYIREMVECGEVVHVDDIEAGKHLGEQQ